MLKKSLKILKRLLALGVCFMQNNRRKKILFTLNHTYRTHSIPMFGINQHKLLELRVPCYSLMYKHDYSVRSVRRFTLFSKPSQHEGNSRSICVFLTLFQNP